MRIGIERRDLKSNDMGKQEGVSDLFQMAKDYAKAEKEQKKIR